RAQFREDSNEQSALRLKGQEYEMDSPSQSLLTLSTQSSLLVSASSKLGSLSRVRCVNTTSKADGVSLSERGAQRCEDCPRLPGIDDMSSNQLRICAIEEISNAELEPDCAPLRRSAHVGETIGADHFARLIEGRVRSNPIAGEANAPPGVRRRDLERCHANVLRRVVHPQSVEHGRGLARFLGNGGEMPIPRVEERPVGGDAGERSDGDATVHFQAVTPA